MVLPRAQRVWHGNIATLDLRSLALFRILLGCVLLSDLLSRWTHLQAHYGDYGVLPRSVLLTTVWHPVWFSLGTVVDQTTGLRMFFLVFALAVLSLMAGWQTRWATFAVWIAVVSLHNLNPLVLDLGDTHLRLVLFWTLFLPWGAVWSVDARQGRLDESLLTPRLQQGSLSSLVGLALPLQVTLMSCSLALALWELKGGARGMGYLVTVVAALLASLLLWIPYREGRIRSVVALLLVALNLVGLLLWPSLFFGVAACLPLALLGASWWEGRMVPLTRRIDRLSGPSGVEPQRTSRASAQAVKEAFYAVLLVYAFGWAFAHLLGFGRPGSLRDPEILGLPGRRSLPGPSSLASPGHFLRLDPSPERSPRLQVEVPRLVMEGRRGDGTTLSRSQAKDVSFQGRDRRWRNYIATLLASRDPWLLHSYGQYLGRAWSPRLRTSLHAMKTIKVSVVRADGAEEVLLDHRYSP